MTEQLTREKQLEMALKYLLGLVAGATSDVLHVGKALSRRSGRLSIASNFDSLQNRLMFADQKIREFLS